MRDIPPAAPTPHEWQRFLSRALALMGAGLALAGVVCFFAYNWSRIGRFGKLGLIAAGIAGAALLGWRLRGLAGQIALAAAAVLVGPLLGVYGQTYQTGADPYGLFLTWALLIVPWVLAARFAVLWVIALAVLDVGLWLWWTQAGAPGGSDGELSGWLTVGLVHAAAVAAWEWQRRRPVPWLREAWAPRALAAVGYGLLFVPAAAFVLDPDSPRRGINAPGLVGLVALGAAIAVAFTWYRRVHRDRFVMTAAGAAALALVAVAVGRVLVADLDLGEFGVLLVALLVVAEIAFGLHWLRRERAPAVESDETRGEVDDDDAMPWYVRVAAGFGAWVAIALFVGFLIMAGIQPNERGAAVVGVGLVAGAVLLRRRAAAEFARQLALAASFAGQLLIMLYVGDATDSITSAAIVVLALSAALIALVPDAAHRFMSAVAGAVATVAAAVELRLAWGVDTSASGFDLAVRGSDLGVLVLVALAAWLWRADPRTRGRARAAVLVPVGYGIVVALFGILLFDAFLNPLQSALGSGRGARSWQLGAATTIGITAMLCALALSIVRERGAAAAREALAAAIGGALLLAALTLSTPGIVAAVAVLALGFERRRPVLVGLAVLFVLAFATLYYYSLRLTLLEKSGVLVASGLLLLAAGAYVARRFAGPTRARDAASEVTPEVTP